MTRTSREALTHTALARLHESFFRQLRKLLELLRPTSLADASHLALALSWIGGDDNEFLKREGLKEKGIGKWMHRYVEATFLRREGR